MTRRTGVRGPLHRAFPISAAACRTALRAAVLVLSLTAADVLAQPVDLELVLAIDTSPSVDRGEYALQVKGFADAFRSAGVVAAIEAVGQAGIAVCVTQWSSAGQNRLALDWTTLNSAAHAQAFATRLAAMPRYHVAGETAIGAAIAFAIRLLDTNTLERNRRIIDISGDGESNQGVSLSWARERAVAAGITINGLAILNEYRWLDRYYRETVIEGPSAFVITAADYDAFAEAIRAKFVREIGGVPVAADDPPADMMPTRGVEEARLDR